MLFALIAIIFILCVIYEKRFETMLVPVIAASMLVLYVLSVFQKLLWFPYFTYAAVLACIVHLFLEIRRKPVLSGWLLRAVRNVFTPGFVCFCVLAVLIYPHAMMHFVITSDDIRYWGLQPLSLYASNGLVEGSQHLSPRFMTYTPGMPLLQWMGMFVYGEWNEGVLFLVNWLFTLALTLPFTQFISWKRGWLILPVLPLLIVFPYAIGVDPYGWLGVDTLLGLLFGYALIEFWQIRLDQTNARFHLLCGTFGLLALVLTKQAGIGWALMAVFMLLFVIRPWKFGRITWLQTALSSISPLLLLGSWQWVIALKHLGGGHYDLAMNRTKDLLSGASSLGELSAGLGQVMWNTLTHGGVQLQAQPPLLILSLLCWVLILCLLPLLLSRVFKQHAAALRHLVIWAVVCFALYLIGSSYVFITAFTNIGDAAGNRYFAPYLVGILYLVVFLLVQQIRMCPDHRRLSLAAGCGLLIVLLLCTNWTRLYSEFNEEKYYANRVDLLWEVRDINMWVQDLEEPQNAKVLFAMMPASFNEEWLQFTAAPAKLSIYSNKEIDEDGFVQLLKDRQITHFVCIDEDNVLYEVASFFTEDGCVETLCAYEVVWDGEVPSLVY